MQQQQNVPLENPVGESLDWQMSGDIPAREVKMSSCINLYDCVT